MSSLNSKQKVQLKKIADILAKPDSKIFFFNGAGISATSDGEPLIPDFRSPGTGLFYNLKKLNLPLPESVFDIDFFEENPRPFYSLCKDLHPKLLKFPPTRYHYFMKLVNEKCNLIRIYTQNIDTLERLTGIPNDKIVEAHGSFADNYCTSCGEPARDEHFDEQLLRGVIPKCEKCELGILKPSIVFYGEQLPDRYYECSESDFIDGSELSIFAGSSLRVYPFAGLCDEVPETSKRILINKELCGDFESNPRKTDLVFLEDCDMIADELAELCGWKRELDELVQKGKKEFSTEKVHVKSAKEMVEDMKQDKNLDEDIKIEKKEKETVKKNDQDEVEELAEVVEKLEIGDKK